jgi:hypothetical protein
VKPLTGCKGRVNRNNSNGTTAPSQVPSDHPPGVLSWLMTRTQHCASGALIVLSTLQRCFQKSFSCVHFSGERTMCCTTLNARFASRCLLSNICESIPRISTSRDCLSIPIACAPPHMRDALAVLHTAGYSDCRCAYYSGHLKPLSGAITVKQC